MHINESASEEVMNKYVSYGAKDISISRDSQEPHKQDQINGGFPGWRQRAIESIAKVTKHFLSANCLSSLGCALAP